MDDMYLEKKKDAMSYAFKCISAKIDELLQSDKESLLVVIDGMCGSGKSTLGKMLAGMYDCNLFHMDDFFLQPKQRTAERLQEPGGNVDYERFNEEVLGHLQDKEGFSYRVFDCSRQEMGRKVDVPFKRLNIIEGAYSVHPYFGEMYDFAFFAEVSEEEQIKRLTKRSGEEKLQRFINEWIPKENTYFETFQIKDKCICIRTDVIPEIEEEAKRESGMIGLIVAYSKNRVIGNKGQIPWRIKGEQKRFRELTTGNVVIMGRRSYEEIGRPLPNRYTIVVSNTQRFEAENCTTVGSLAEAIRIADKEKNIYISGGAGLYKEAIDLVDVMYITEIDAIIEGDTYFPEFNMDEFDREVDCHVEGDIPYDYVTYTRKEKK